MRTRLLPPAIIATLLAGCCLPPTQPGVEQAAAPSDGATKEAATAKSEATATPPAGTEAPAAATAAALAVAGNAAPAVAKAPAGAPAAAAPPAVGALLAGGTQYAYEDVGISLTVPSGWTQQLMTGGVVALFSGDYPTKGKRDRGAIILVSGFKGTIPADDQKLTALLKDGLDPNAVVVTGPSRTPIADKQGAQIVAKGIDEDGAKYDVVHTLLQSGSKALSVKSIAFDGLSTRNPVFDAVTESITFTGKSSGR